MTRTEARHVAAVALSHGHYHQTDSPDYSADCPQCKTRVTTQRQWQWRRARKGEPYVSQPDVLSGKPARFEQEQPRMALVRALVSHLLNECAGDVS